MNCKQGDLAMVVRSWARNEGKIVTCIRLTPYQEHDLRDFGYVWQVDAMLRDADGNESRFIHDDQLRPLRNDPGQDETIAWAGLPEEIEIPVQEVAG